MHEDKGFVGFTKIKKEDWDRIFKRKKEPGTITTFKVAKKGRVRRDKDDFMNRPTPWV